MYSSQLQSIEQGRQIALQMEETAGAVVSASYPQVFRTTGVRQKPRRCTTLLFLLCKEMIESRWYKIKFKVLEQ